MHKWRKQKEENDTFRPVDNEEETNNNDMAKKTLQMLSGYDILAPNGFVIVQHSQKENLPESAGDLVFIKQYVYGSTTLSFYRKKG